MKLYNAESSWIKSYLLNIQFEMMMTEEVGIAQRGEAVIGLLIGGGGHQVRTEEREEALTTELDLPQLPTGERGGVLIMVMAQVVVLFECEVVLNMGLALAVVLIEDRGVLCMGLVTVQAVVHIRHQERAHIMALNGALVLITRSVHLFFMIIVEVLIGGTELGMVMAIVRVQARIQRKGPSLTILGNPGAP